VVLRAAWLFRCGFPTAKRCWRNRKEWRLNCPVGDLCSRQWISLSRSQLPRPRDLQQFEADLWEAADKLRANSKLTSSDYFMPVLGVIASVVPGHITESATVAFQGAPSRARRIVQHGDIIWSCVRPNRRSHAVIWKPSDNLIVSTGFAVITPTGAPSTFLYFATTTKAFVGCLENPARGAAYPAVVASDFE